MVMVKQLLLKIDVTVVVLAVEDGQSRLLSLLLGFALDKVPLESSTGHFVA